MWRANVRREQPTMCAAASSVIVLDLFDDRLLDPQQGAP